MEGPQVGLGQDCLSSEQKVRDEDLFNLEKRLLLRDLTSTLPIPTWELFKRQKQNVQRFTTTN